MRPCLLIAALFLALAPRASASPFRATYDLDDLPLLKTGVRTFQVSSHDPTGGNEDFGHFAGGEGAERVLADLQGPGIVRRLWTPNAHGQLRIFIDGAARPVVDTPFENFYSGSVPGFRAPLVQNHSGGSVSYVPIAFQASCRITVSDPAALYYQVTWQKLPSDAGLVPFSGAFNAAEQAEYDAAVKAWSAIGRVDTGARFISLPARAIRLAPGERWVQPIKGPGTITTLRFRFPAGANFTALRQTVLRITFDNEKNAVEAPLADFLGIGFDHAAWKSLPLGVTPPLGALNSQGYCNFRMPFRRSARIELENEGRQTVKMTFTGTARAGVPKAAWGYFHAGFHHVINEAGQDDYFGRLRGAGHVVGVSENMRGSGGLGFLEGDEKVYVDDDTEPSIYGTGTEDFYNGGWYFREGPYNAPLSANIFKGDSEIAAARFQIPDAIPFTQRLDFRMEHGGTDDAPGSEYASVLYWYGAAGAHDANPPMPRGALLLPRPAVPAVQNAVAAVDAPWTSDAGATVRTQTWQSISPYRGTGRALLKGVAGAEMTTGIATRFADNYTVDLYLSGASTSSTARFLVDGQPVGESVPDAPGPLPVRKVTIGPLALLEGKHTVGLRLENGSALGLVAFRVVPGSPLVKDYAVLGGFPAPAETGVNAALEPDGRAPELDRAFRSDGRDLRWTILHVSDGVLDLAASLTPNANAVAYAAFAVNAPEAGTRPLFVGSDDGVKVYVNGKAVFTNRKARGLILDEDRVDVPLRAGWNTITLKVDQGVGGWSVAARIPDPSHTLQFAATVPAGK